MKIKKPNISKEVFEIGDLVRIHTPSDKTRQVWSNEVYKIDRLFPKMGECREVLGGGPAPPSKL